MDCIFNKYIPPSSSQCVVIPPGGKTWLNGLAERYDDTYPRALEGFMTREDFKKAMNEINDVLFNYWPCFLCFNFGYFCCLCTAGLSFCPSLLCIYDAKENLRTALGRLNKYWESQGIVWSLHTKCSTSWLELYLKGTN